MAALITKITTFFSGVMTMITGGTIGSWRTSLFLMNLTTFASQYLCFFLTTCKSTTSPGTQKGTKMTWSSTRVMHFPSAATASMVTFSINGNGLRFLPMIDI